MSSNDTLTKLIKDIIENRLFEVHTSLPGKIQSYDEKTHKAEVQPIMKRILTTDEILDTPIIANVPVIFPRTKNFIMHYPIEKGDRVLLVFAERSLDNYLSDGSEDPIVDGKKYDITDAIAIPGFFPFNEISSVENNKDFVINFKNRIIKIDEKGVFEFKNEKTTFTFDDSGIIEISNGIGTIKIDQGKIAFGTQANELVDLLDQVIDSLIASVVPTAIGPQRLSEVTNTNIPQIKAKLQTIKGSL